MALGLGVRVEPVYSDALAVARKTVSRARTNIETLIVRRDGIGDRFDLARDTPPETVQQIRDIQRAVEQQLELQFPGLREIVGPNKEIDELYSSFDKKLAPASTLDERSVYFPAQEWSAGYTSRLEEFLTSPLPISLKAWSENVVHVSFTGSHPVLNPATKESLGQRKTAPLTDLLALMTFPDEVDYESWESPEGYPIAIDEFFKARRPLLHRLPRRARRYPLQGLAQ